MGMKAVLRFMLFSLWLFHASIAVGTVLINGSFENTPPGTIEEHSVPVDFGWSLIGSVDVLNEGLAGPGTAAAADGSQYIDLNGGYPGAVYQDVTFNYTGDWTIRFAMSANPTEGGVKTMQVEFGPPESMAVVGTYEVDSAGMTWDELIWHEIVMPTFTVQASNTYRLQFTSTTTNLPASGPLLDHVRLGAEPESSIRVSQVEVCWNSASNRVYQVQYRSALTTNEWINLGEQITATNEATCVFDPVLRGQPQRFYRVLRLP